MLPHPALKNPGPFPGEIKIVRMNITGFGVNLQLQASS